MGTKRYWLFKDVTGERCTRLGNICAHAERKGQPDYIGKVNRD